MAKKVYCADCKFFLRQGTRDTCSHKKRVIKRDTPLRQETVYPDISEINTNNDCNLYEPRPK